jgi:hypothetical protein
MKHWQEDGGDSACPPHTAPALCEETQGGSGGKGFWMDFLTVVTHQRSGKIFGMKCFFGTLNLRALYLTSDN